MPETVEICPLCDKPQADQRKDSTQFDRRSFHDVPVTNRMCMNCGLVYQSPRMTEAELEDFYQAEYRQLYQGSAGPNPKDLAIQAGRADALVSFSKQTLTHINRHLDIGSSAGLLLQKFQQVYRCEPTGIEPGQAYRAYAQGQELDIYSSLSDLASEQPGRFDLISLAHVLEHIPEPVNYLSNLRQEWLASGGWLLVEVPNLYGHNCFEIAHMVSYSPHTLKQVLQRAGFQVQSESIHGRPRSELIPLYITILARFNNLGQAADVTQAVSLPDIEPETGVKRKRQAAILRRKLVERLSPRKAWLPINA